jgi:hypothetical protein
MEIPSAESRYKPINDLPVYNKCKPFIQYYIAQFRKAIIDDLNNNPTAKTSKYLQNYFPDMSECNHLEVKNNVIKNGIAPFLEKGWKTSGGLNDFSTVFIYAPEPTLFDNFKSYVINN